MTPDMVAELLRQLMKEAIILSAPLLIAAVLLSFVLSLVQTLTSLQEQSLTSVPRLAAIALILLVAMPWFLERLATYTRLLPAGVRIFQHNPMVHTKALLVDDAFVSLGSYNFDHRSLVYNLELVVNSLDREHAAEVAALLETDMAASHEVDWQIFRRRSLLTRLLERLAYSFRHWF